MENELKEKLLALKNELKSRNNSSASFFEKLIIDVDSGLLDEVIESIIKGFAITQYGNFNHKEELLYTDIWNLADKIKKHK
jgi:hypothetical protein